LIRLIVLIAMATPIAAPTVVAGAPSPAAVAEAPASDAEALRAIAAYNRWAGGLSTLRAGGKATLGGKGLKERAFRLALVLARPERLRLQGRWGNLTTLFDLAADAGGWTLFLPREHRVVRSSQDDATAGMILPPANIAAAVFPSPVSLERLRRDGAFARDARGLRVVIPPGDAESIHRVLWLDPATGGVRRLEVRRESQLEAPLLRVDYEDYRGEGATRFPRRVMLRSGEAWGRFEFSSIKLNETLDARRFRIHVPRGTEAMALDDLTPDFLPEAEPGSQ